MVDLAMSIFEILTNFLVLWHPWHPSVCIRSDLKQIWAIPPTVHFNQWLSHLVLIKESKLKVEFKTSKWALSSWGLKKITLLLSLVHMQWSKRDAVGKSFQFSMVGTQTRIL